MPSSATRFHRSVGAFLRSTTTASSLAPHLDRREKLALNHETVILLFWPFSAAVAAAIAHTKNRSVGEGFLWPVHQERPVGF